MRPAPHGPRAASALGRSTAAAVSLVLAWSVVGVVLALVGAFHVALVVALTLVIGSLGYRLWPRSGPAVRASSAVVWIVAIVIAAVSTVVNASLPAEQMIGGRDGATYLATAAWLADDGNLLVEARVGAFSERPDLDFISYGFYDARADGKLTPQFLHALPALQATADGLGGSFLLLRLNAILGGLALMMLFAFAQLLVRPWLALVAEATLAVNLVFAYFARAPFSEILALIFVFGGLWALWTAWETRNRPTACLAGLLLGATLMARIDGLVLVIPLVVVLAYERSRSEAPPDTDRLVSTVWIGLLGSMAVAFCDVVLIDPSYLAQQRSEVLLSMGGIIAVISGDVLLGRHLATWTRRLVQRRRMVAGASAILVILVLGFFWFVRPHVQRAAGSPYLIELARGSEEVADFESRSFAEQSARWLTWYLGPAGLALGVAGWAVLTRRLVEGRDRLVLPFLAVFSTTTLLYLWRPSINPDHIWAMRRYLPVAIPGLLVLAALAIDAFCDMEDSVPGMIRRAGMSIAVIGLVGGSVAALAPVASVHEYRGLAADFYQACDSIGSDSALLYIDTPAASMGERLAQSFRSYCGVPTAYTAAVDRSDVTALSRAWSEHGRRLWLVSVDTSVLQELSGAEAVPLMVGSYDVLEITLTERPERIGEVGVSIYGIPAPLS